MIKKNLLKQYFGLLVVLVVVLLSIFSFILYNQWPLLTGNKIVLSTQPVDPFDPFRGQYMRINYEISRLSNVSGFKVGDTIYVILREDEAGIWRPEGVSKTKPESGVFIKGNVKRIFGSSVFVDYGIEQFFFERNAKLPTRNITVEVGVASSGRAKLSRMLYDGKPINITYKRFSITN